MYSSGAQKSKYDIRTFSFIPTGANVIGGSRYEKKDIENQWAVGICTAISLTQNARKALGTKFSADFQYLIQKKYVDGNWDEGSSIFSALKAGKNYGLLPEKYWTFTTEKDRKLSYSRYIKKLQSISDKDIQKLLDISKDYRLSAYASVSVDRDLLAKAIDESQAGILARFAIDKNWWTAPIEPLRRPTGKSTITGHAIIESNYNGNSMRIANMWGSDWADGGTAYHLLRDYSPTEAWIPYYGGLPEPIEVQKENRSKIIGQILDYLQKIIALLPGLA